MVKKMLEVVVKYLYPAFTKVKILAFTVYSSLSRICRPRLAHLCPSPGILNTLQVQSSSAGFKQQQCSLHQYGFGGYSH